MRVNILVENPTPYPKSFTSYPTQSATKRSIMLLPLVSRATSSVQQALPHRIAKRIRPQSPTYPPPSTPRLITSQTENSSNGSLQAPRRPSESSEPPANPSFSLQDLGANRTVRVVVVASLSIIATMESMFWIRVGWAKFGQSKEEGGVIRGSDPT